MNQPLISIIIPTYNRAKLLSKTIDSILAQTYTNWECIIVDDGSTDDTEKTILAIKDIRIRYFKRNENHKKGPSSCRNIGVSLSKGEFIQFFDDDDIMFPTKLQTKIIAITNKNSDVVVAPLQFYDVVLQKNIKVNIIKPVNNSILEDYILTKISWYVSGPMWKKSFLTYQFDENIQTLDDWDYNIQNILNNPKIIYLDNPLQYYNIFPKGQTLSTKGSNGDIQQKESSIYTYKKTLLSLKEKGLLTPIIEKTLTHRLTNFLNFFLIHKQPISKDLYLFLQNHLHSLGLKNALKIKMGYYCYKYFGFGYSFFKI